MGAATASAESRMALVIGNSAYQTVTTLPNPVNDAKAIAEHLKAAGFEVTTVQDAVQSELRQAIGQFADALTGKGSDTVALVYFAGHGLQVDGENYLVPVDASILREADVPFQAVRLSDLMNALASVPTKARIVMLDACRNNPFSEINKVTGKGLAIVDAPPNSIISYSTSPGSEALDGDGANSPYTTAVLALTKEPGLPIEQAFKRVRFAVNDATNRHQLPWESSSLTTDFAFFGGAPAFALASAPSDGKPQATPVSVRPGAIPTTGRSGRSVDAWKRELQRRMPSEAYEIVSREDTVEAYQAYLALFPAQAMTSRVREVLDRRRVMIAWYAATTIDSVASYEAFLATYADTDLAPTARRLLERAKNRMQLASTSNTCPCALIPGQPIQQQQQQQQQKPQPPEQKATRSLDKKHAKKEKKEKKKEKVAKKGKRPPKDEEASTPAAPVQQAAPVIPIGIGLGIGFGGGGFGGGRGMGGGGMGGSKPMPTGSHYGR
jgi:hypothetical protein